MSKDEHPTPNHPKQQGQQPHHSDHPQHPAHQPVVDPNSIARFHNPNNTTKLIVDPSAKDTSPPAQHQALRGGHLVAAKEAEVVRKPVPTSHVRSHEHTNNDKRKADARIKLTQMRRRSHWQTVRFAAVSFVVFLIIFNFQLIYSQALYFFNSRNTPKIASTAPVTPAAPTNQAEVVEGPDVIIIPKINVTAPLVFIDTIDERNVLTALQNGVVHYAGTANPGENGNAVFFGHSSNDLWEKGNYKFVFALLEKLNVGDQYEIHYQQRKYVYLVEETKVVQPTDLSVLDQTATPYSTLITCTPPGTSWRRFVVKAKQIIPANSQVATTVQPTYPPVQGSVLPSAPPGIFEQIQIALGSLLNTILGKNSGSSNTTSPTLPSTRPANHLPDVSHDLRMPTTF